MKNSTLICHPALRNEGNTRRSHEFGPPTKSGASKVVNVMFTDDPRFPGQSNSIVQFLSNG